MSETIIVLDFGSQYSQLIARRIRECRVYSKIMPFNTPADVLRAENPKGIILSGGPSSVYAKNAPKCDPAVFELGIPILGICYGLQLMIQTLGGEIARGKAREYGKAILEIREPGELFAGISPKTQVWMSHGDKVAKMPEGGFEVLGSSGNTEFCAVHMPERNFYGIQFHPEVVHTPEGKSIVANFCRRVCACSGDWTMESFIEQQVREIRKKVGKSNVILGLSGGVDSSVAATLLARAGHEVVGITMKIWREGRFAGGPKDACYGPGEADDIARAEALSRRLGIPYHVFDCAGEYETVVLDYFKREYLAGHTPNPCVRCNAFLKFGVLPGLARKSGLAFDRFATGHYARIREEDGRFRLLRGADETKDQSYFLYRLTQAQLAGLLFPLGELRKSEVRALAAEFGLEVKDQPDSQDFYSGDHAELIGAPDRPGDIVDETGRVLGRHSGFWKFTIGQRKGLGVAHPRPLYVLAVDACRNEVVVGTAERTRRRALVAGDCRWVSIAPPSAPLEVQIKIRSTGHPVPGAMLHPHGDGRVEARLGGEGLAGVAPGQSAVFYQGDVLLGGGIIEEAG